MFLPLTRLFDYIVVHGQLAIEDASGERHYFGDGSGPPVTVRLKDRGIERALVLDPELAFGEAYMQGRLDVIEGDISDFVFLIVRNLPERPLTGPGHVASLLRRLVRRLAQFNPVGRARRNVTHHYDIDPRIYELFLDRERQYSCAYFAEPSTGLDEAQRAKMRHIASKLRLEPGLRILDIGSGWGGLGLYLARTAAAEVVGITLSDEQLKSARARACALGLGHRVQFQSRDYRNIDDRFDRIVSVGMFEHVGLPHYGAYFRAVAEHLAPDGVALVHTIGRTDRPAPTHPFVARHVFPGGYIPALSEIMRSVEKSGLVVTDVEVLRLHYAETLKAWRERFRARRAEAVEIAGESFTRLWELYLAGAEACFRYQGFVVFQLQLAKSVDNLPLTRTYMLDAERRLSLHEQGPGYRPRLAGE